MPSPRNRKIIGGGIAGTAGVLSLLFLQAFGTTNLTEGGCVNHPDDLGGGTNRGITEQVAWDWGWRGHICDLPEEVSEEIAWAKYWHPLMLDDIGEETPALANRLYDIGFNAGTSRAGGFLQRCLNVLNSKGRHYADIQVDGRVGPATVAAHESYMAHRDDEEVLLTCVRGLMVYHYVNISEKREANESFTYGWLRRAAE